MKRSIRLTLSAGAATLLFLSAPAWALHNVGEGIYRFDPNRTDALLTLGENSDIAVLLVDDKGNKKLLSESHIKLTRDWVLAGGVLWAVEEGLKNPLVEQIAPYRVGRFKYKKTATGKGGGELIVKGASPRLVIHDHPLTSGVSQLYLFPKYKFDGTQHASSLVELTDTKGNHGLVMAALKGGKGLVILDGTARKNAAPLMGRLSGFDDKHPNAIKQGSGWNSYDWKKLWDNARAHAQMALAGVRR